jgi:transcription elongation factor GreA
MERIPMTANGFARLQDELKRLKSVERPRVLKALEEARAHGDLSENAEYDAARHEQGLIEGRISELETKTRIAQVIDVTKLSGSDVKFGATVKLQDVDNSAKVTYQVVGADEADIKAGLLSVTSPLGRALIGKSEGALLEVSAPGGVKTYELLKVEYK